MAKLVFRDPWNRETTVEHEITGVLASERSEFQQIDILETVHFGRALALGGVVNVAERDEHGYHEMLVHVPLMAHPDPKRVLIIGGGDGGTLREVCKHPGVEQAVQVEIDGRVVDLCKQFLPQTAVGYDHPKAELVIGDGLAYVENAPDGSFDVILVDSTDPVDAADVLFTPEFYRECLRVLSADGILVPQSDSIIYQEGSVERVVRSLSSIFPVLAMYQTYVPTYPGTVWMFAFASKGPDPDVFDERRVEGLSLEYYNLELHRAAFVLPTVWRDKIAGWQQ